MPHFLQFSKNGRRRNSSSESRAYCKPNDSTMNRICQRFERVKSISANIKNLPPFNWKMLVSKDCLESRFGREEEADIISCFSDAVSANASNFILAQSLSEENEKTNAYGWDILADFVETLMTEKFGSLESTQPVIVKHLFYGPNASKPYNKHLFWLVYGEIT